MRIHEIAEREDLPTILRATLGRGFSTMVGREVRVAGPTGAGQRWFEQPLVSAYVVRDVSDEARRFLVDETRYTPRRSRAIPQWLVATAAGTRLGFRLAGRPAFSTDPAIPGAADLVIIPGNQRVRLLDFGRRVSRVLLKEGFSPRSLATEISVREDGAGPYPPILERDPAGHWIVEPLLRGFTLPRCPPWRSRAGYERRAVAQLDAYHEAHRLEASTGEYLDEVRAAIATEAAAIATMEGAPTGIDARVEALAARSLARHRVELARGHGDFQAGNVFVEPDTDRVWLIDWETSAVRQRAYDHLTYGLGARFPVGLGERARSFVDGAGLGPAGSSAVDVADRAGRAATAALFLLEDLRWRLEQATSGRYLRLPSSVGRLVAEIDVFLRK